MMNPIAEKLIYNLRHNPHTRRHFSISEWDGRRTCGTVGCIAGTAIAMHYEFNPIQEFTTQARECLLSYGGDYSWAASSILGISRNIGDQLFVPRTCWIWPVLLSRHDGELPHFLEGLNHNERPPASTLETWEKFIRANFPDDLIFKESPIRKRMSSLFNPDACANALEQVTLHEMPYVDWHKACLEAETI